MKASGVLTFLFLVAIAKLATADPDPSQKVFRYIDDDGYIRMGVLRKPEESKPFSIVPSSSSAESSQQSDSEINPHDTSAYIHEFSHSDATLDDFYSMHDSYEKKEHESDEGMFSSAVEEDNSSNENKKFNVYAKSPKFGFRKNSKSKKFSKAKKPKPFDPPSEEQPPSEEDPPSNEDPPSPPHSEEDPPSSEENPPSPTRKPRPPHPHPTPKPPKSSSESHSSESHEHKCKPCKAKKKVFVYKQQPIIVHPKPTSVLIKSKPIVVQPPPLVVHQQAPKPCKPIINYEQPEIKVKPVIVKIRKPSAVVSKPPPSPAPCSKPTKPPCEKPTKPPCEKKKKKCRKCQRKPIRKCNRCQRKKCHCKSNNHSEIWT